ncbi:hypothetical protein D3C80_2195890 [compost metagenome]
MLDRGSGYEAVFWAYTISQFSDLAAVFYFSPSHAGEHSRNFLHLNGKMVWMTLLAAEQNVT